MFRRIADFVEAWKYESGKTAELMRALTPEAMATPVSSGGRSLGFIAWHITGTLSEMLPTAGLPVSGAAGEPMPDSPAELARIYEERARAASEAVQSAWTDEQLGDKIPMYGEEWFKGGVLAALIAHQAHHRGQMTVLMRQAGLKVPGVYGPAREEWAAFGMEPQA